MPVFSSDDPSCGMTTFLCDRIGLYSVKLEIGLKHVKALLYAAGSEALWPQSAVETVSAGSNMA